MALTLSRQCEQSEAILQARVIASEAKQSHKDCFVASLFAMTPEPWRLLRRRALCPLEYRNDGSRLPTVDFFHVANGSPYDPFQNFHIDIVQFTEVNAGHAGLVIAELAQ